MGKKTQTWLPKSADKAAHFLQLKARVKPKREYELWLTVKCCLILAKRPSNLDRKLLQVQVWVSANHWVNLADILPYLCT